MPFLAILQHSFRPGSWRNALLSVVTERPPVARTVISAAEIAALQRRKLQQHYGKCAELLLQGAGVGA